MKYLLLLLLLPTVSFAGNPFKLKDLYVEIEKPVGQTRTLKRYETRKKNPEKKAGELNLGMLTEADFKILTIYSAIEVKSVFTTRQFREVALETEMGLTVDYVDVYFRHMSAHGLDMQLNQYYPQDNAVGIRIHFGGK